MKVLIVRIGRMGDIAMVLPAIRKIQADFPQASLYALTSEDGMRLLPLANIPKDHIQIYRSKLTSRISVTRAIKRWLVEQAFDKIFCFETKERYVSWLPQHAQILKNQANIQHYSERCLQLVSPAPKTMIPQEAYLSMPSEHQSMLNNILREHQITDRTIVIGFHPTYSGYGKWNRKKDSFHRLWSADNFAQLALELTSYAKEKQIDLKIVMNLLPNEIQYGQELIKKSANTIESLSFPPGFTHYLAYLQRLNCLIVGNTGILHLAAALNIPLIALFSGLSPQDCGPFMAEQRYKVLRAEDMPNPQNGIQAITVAQVFQHTIKLLQQ